MPAHRKVEEVEEVESCKFYCVTNLQLSTFNLQQKFQYRVEHTISSIITKH